MMKTCVLFPKAFTYNYISGSVAHSLDVPASYELYLNPDKMAQPNGIRNKIRRSLSLVNHKKDESTSKSKPKLLHVDDSAQIRLLVSIFLKSEFDVESVSSGELALRQLQTSNYDLILMDINLGDGIDGFETSKKIRESEQYKNTPIIALSTNDYDQVRSECIYSRINAYIQKPFDKGYLLGTIHEIYRHLAKNNGKTALL